MKSDLERDLMKLRGLAFRRVERVGELLKEIHSVRATCPHHSDLTDLEVVRRWLLMPFTLWPVDFVGLGRYIVTLIREDREVPPEIRFVIERVSGFPPAKAQRTVAAHERQVEKGRYEKIIKPEARLKFREKERQICEDPEFREEWRKLKELFNMTVAKDEKRVIRRRMVQERNFRPDWDFSPEDKTSLFKVVFDAFCHRWNLYGMEGDKPLVLKLSVNLTAHGTMIVVPAFWSFDTTRDLDWNEIMKLHRPRVSVRQGPVLSMSRLARGKQAKRTKRLWDMLKRKGFKGDKLYRRIKEELGVPDSFTDREIRRLKLEAKC